MFKSLLNNLNNEKSHSERSEESIIYQLVTEDWIFRFAVNDEILGFFN